MTEVEELAARIRAYLGNDPRITEKRMFGGLGYLINNNMFLGVTPKGALMARNPKGEDDAIRSLPTTGIDLATQKMGGFVVLPPAASNADKDLKAWIDFSLSYAEKLPPK